MAPVRMQRKRTKGFRLPAGSIYVGRPSRWGNPYRVGAEPIDGGDGQTIEEVMWAYEHLQLPHLDVSPLRGKDLACWCPLNQPCHADILLKAANQGA